MAGQPAETDRAWFSPILNRIAAVAGVRAALMLGQEKGCKKIYIPKAAASGHWLPALVGTDAADAIMKEFGGSWIEIPPALVGQTRRRRLAIAEMNAKGYSLNKISSAAGVARSTVKRHRRRLKDDDQGTLL